MHPHTACILLQNKLTIAVTCHRIGIGLSMQGKYPSRIGEFGIILPQYTWSQRSRSSQWRGSHASKRSCHQKLEVSICIWSILHCHQADCISSWSAKSRSLYSEGGTNFHFHKIKQAISEFQINLKIVLCGLWFMVYSGVPP